MPEFVVTVQNLDPAEMAEGALIQASDWGPFDHAALVTALRSRADGYDMWMYHTTTGRVTLAA